jgi:hypothetical protein
MMVEKITIGPEDLDLTKKYELFDVIYSISKGETDNEVNAWIVIGHVLNSSSESRCFEYHLCSYPISLYVAKNEHTRLSDIRQHFISTDRSQVLEWKKELLIQQFNERIEKLV